MQPAETPDAAPPLREPDGAINPAFVEAMRTALSAGNRLAATALAGDLHEADLGALIEALEPDERPKLVALMGREFDFAALTEVDDAVRDEILEELPPAAVAEGVRDLDIDDAVAILEDLDAAEREEVLEALPATERVALRKSLDYPEGSAGRMMQAGAVTAPGWRTVGQMIDFLRDAGEDDLPSSFYDVFVVAADGRLLGNVFLDRLLRTRRPTRLDEIMDAGRRRVGVDAPREEVARLFERYNLVSLPVIDEAGRLVGVITIDDALDVIEEEASEDILALGGVQRGEALSDDVLSIAKSRFLWLFVNLLTAFLASSVLGRFEDELQKMVALAVLVPIVASQGGNAATQTMTVAVRALATRELSAVNALRVTLREASVGLINGAAFGLLTGLIAGGWYASAGIGVVIALAMLTNLVAGALGGILIPLALERLRFDPAVASGAFVTTVTDVVGNFAFLGIATLWFGLA